MSTSTLEVNAVVVKKHLQDKELKKAKVEAKAIKGKVVLDAEKLSDKVLSRILFDQHSDNVQQPNYLISDGLSKTYTQELAMRLVLDVPFELEKKKYVIDTDIYRFRKMIQALKDDTGMIPFACRILKEIDREYIIYIRDIDLRQSLFGSFIQIIGEYSFWDVQIEFERRIGFAEVQGKSLREIFAKLGMRLATPDELQTQHRLVRQQCEEMSKLGKVIDNAGPVFEVHNGFFSGPYLSYVPSRGKREQFIIDGEEASANEVSRPAALVMEVGGDRCTMMPFVRCFSTKHKEYRYIDVRDIKDHVFQDCLHKLIIGQDRKDVLAKVLAPNLNQTFSDVIEGKGGGMVILANGPSGVGKTLTAEIFAEHTKRPLYNVDISELGTNVDTIETKLRTVFTRATRWNAILLLDEADIFLHTRGEDMHRNAVVGVFLRVMDYYHGILFITTNRADIIDTAFRSRITLKMDYQALTPQVKSKIWEMMLNESSIQASYTQADYDALGELDLNGREIRNNVRLLERIFDKQPAIGEIKKIVNDYSVNTMKMG